MAIHSNRFAKGVSRRNVDGRLNNTAGMQLEKHYFFCHVLLQTFDDLLPQDTPCRFRMGEMEWKVFNDIIHGHMEFHPLIVSIIDTPQFQRLRYLKQTGPCYFVYPAALHTRFEHSLGTAFLAGKLMNAMNRKRGYIGEDAEKETLIVQIAGLCHDLGHGPFSHTWEHFLERCGKKYEHEIRSVEIFNRILEETVPDKNNVGEDVTIRQLFGKYGLETFIPTIADMILGVKSKRDKKYLYEVISNKTNGIDVDKWDYLLRDSKMTNVPINFDCERLILFCQILRNQQKSEQICYRDKECTVLINMFLTRGLLHDKVYQHRKVKIIEEMLIDAFCLADDTLKLTTIDVNAFLKLTDHIYQKILYEDFEGNEAMAKAKKILEKLERRRLYLCMAAKEIKAALDQSKITNIEEKMFEYLRQQDQNLQRDAIKIIAISINMTKYNKRKNLKNVSLYKKRKNSREDLAIINFDYDNFHGLKPDLTSMPRFELLVLYKGDEFSKYRELCHEKLLVAFFEDLLK